jgi:hypothetical protein
MGGRDLGITDHDSRRPSGCNHPRQLARNGNYSSQNGSLYSIFVNLSVMIFGGDFDPAAALVTACPAWRFPPICFRFARIVNN